MIMGVVNVTPDSFSDGGDFFDPDAAIRHARNSLEMGADLIDLGAESTRPGASPITADIEWRRLEPVIRELVSAGLGSKLSIDTRHEANIRLAHKAGVKWFNNICGVCRGDTLRELAADPDTRYVAMHMHGDGPQTMQKQPLTGKVVVKVVQDAFILFQSELIAAGFSADRIYMDPGIGFGKSVGANLKLISMMPTFAKDFSLLVGVSRKSFLGNLLSIPTPKQRDAASKMLEFSLWNQGVHIIRTHDVETLARIRATLREEC